MAGSWQWRATTTPANPRPWRTSRNSRLSTPRSRSSIRPGSRTSSISGSMAGRCRAIPAAGSRSRPSPRRWTARPRCRSIPGASRSFCRRMSRCRRAGSTSAGPTRRSTRNTACTATNWRPRSRLRAPMGSTASSSTARRRGSASSRPANPISMCGRRSPIAARLATLEAKERQHSGSVVPFQRTPYFCSGCPHNTSTRVPEGSRALAGIGCHYLSQFMDRETATFTQMGGEGVPWIGQAPFVETRHVFANIGDGTYTHSGILAIRSAVAAKVNMTYKVLFNDAVAMTGGQALDGGLTVPIVTRQLAAEGVGPIVVVTDEPDKYPLGTEFPHGATVRHRDELDAVQRELREMPGVTAIVYDQTCAAEKRRRRKRGRFPDPPRRVVVNDLVCEGCGDCSATSNCLSVVPVETEFGRKRAIDQSSCNKDFSCLKGFCPSFVTVEGGSLRQRAAAELDEDGLPSLPEPTLPALAEPYGILVKIGRAHV